MFTVLPAPDSPEMTTLWFFRSAIIASKVSMPMPKMWGALPRDPSR